MGDDFNAFYFRGERMDVMEGENDENDQAAEEAKK
jgi:hypothetical protein